MENLENLANNVARAPKDALRRCYSQLVRRAVGNGDAALLVRLNDRLGIEPLEEGQLVLYERFQADLMKPRPSRGVVRAPPHPERLKTYGERRDGRILMPYNPLTYKRQIRVMAGLLREEPPVGISKLSEGELDTIYWKLRWRAEVEGLI